MRYEIDEETGLGSKVLRAVCAAAAAANARAIRREVAGRGMQESKRKPAHRNDSSL